MPAPVRSGDRERLCFGLEKEPDTFTGNAAVYRICKGVSDRNGKRGHEKERKIEKDSRQ